MNRTPGIRLVLVITALTAILAAPAADARGLEPRGPGARAEAGWLSDALRWLDQVLGFRRPAPRTGSSVTKEDTSGGLSGTGTGDASTMGGSCIDPQGNPRPWCAG